jgi:hypothetical protein
MDVFQQQWGRQLVEIMDFKLCCARHDPVNITQASPKLHSPRMRGIQMRVKPLGHRDGRYTPSSFYPMEQPEERDENSCGLGIVFQLGESNCCDFIHSTGEKKQIILSSTFKMTLYIRLSQLSDVKFLPLDSRTPLKHSSHDFNALESILLSC